MLCARDNIVTTGVDMAASASACYRIEWYYSNVPKILSIRSNKGVHDEH